MNFNKLLKAKANFLNGLIALIVISLIVLGCTCNDKDGFNWKDSDSTDSSDTKRDGDEDRDTDRSDPGDFEADEDTVPTDAQAQALVRRTLLDFNDAVSKGDFADFRETVASRWRDNSRVRDFNKGFKEFIDKKVDISRVRNNDANFSPRPYIDKKYGRQVLFLKGKYDTSPLPVNFNLEYIVDGGEWKLVFIGVDTRRGGNPRGYGPGGGN